MLTDKYTLFVIFLLLITVTCLWRIINYNRFQSYFFGNQYGIYPKIMNGDIFILFMIIALNNSLI